MNGKKNSATTKEFDRVAPNFMCLVFCCVFAALGSVIITPSLPVISHFFSISTDQSQLTVTVFLLGYAIGQLLYGPMANRFGRVATLKISLLVAIIGTILSIASSPFESFYTLLLGRFIEAVGCSGGLVVSFMMVNDYYSPEKAKGKFALLMVASSIVPAMGVFLGGVIAEYVNWQSCFYFLFFYNCLLYVLSLFLQETLENKDMNALHFSHVLVNYMRVLVNRNLLVFGFMVGCSAAFIYVFTAEAPFILIRYLGYSEGFYGVLAMIPPVGVLIGSLLMVRFFDRFTSQQWIGLALLLDFIAILIFLITFSLHVINVYSLIIPVCVLYFGHGLIASTACSLFVLTLKDKGNGTSAGNFIYIAVCVISTFVLTLLHSTNPLVLPVIYLGLISVLLILFFFGRGRYDA